MTRAPTDTDVSFSTADGSGCSPLTPARSSPASATVEASSEERIVNLDALCEVDDVPPELEHDEKVLNERVSNEILATVLMGVRPFPREGRDAPRPRPAAQKVKQSFEPATPSREA